MAFQVQTGNISRAMYDLLKLQHLYATSRISVAALAVPTTEASQLIASNAAQADRVWREVRLFERTITVPLLVLAFQ